jgi:hypothetical protein
MRFGRPSCKATGDESQPHLGVPTCALDACKPSRAVGFPERGQEVFQEPQRPSKTLNTPDSSTNSVFAGRFPANWSHGYIVRCLQLHSFGATATHPSGYSYTASGPRQHSASAARRPLGGDTATQSHPNGCPSLGATATQSQGDAATQTAPVRPTRILGLRLHSLRGTRLHSRALCRRSDRGSRRQSSSCLTDPTGDAGTQPIGLVASGVSRSGCPSEGLWRRCFAGRR